MSSIESLLRPVHGYFELGMFAEACDLLDNLPDKVKSHPAVLHARLFLLVGMERWEDGAILGESLSKIWPDEEDFYLKTAYCLHELKRTQEAKLTLISAPVEIRENSDFAYNLACYEAQLGNLEKAKELLNACFKMTPTFRADALNDPDLVPLWEQLEKNDPR